MNINSCIAVQKIIELGSFTGAAEELGYTQPALSQSVTALEKELQVKILDRSRYGIRLTPEGEQLYPAIQQTIADYRSIQEIAGEINGLESGIVRLVVFSSVSSRWLPGLIRGFWKQYPNVKFYRPSGTLDTIEEMIITGKADFGFTTAPDNSNGLNTQLIKKSEFCAVIPQDHPLADRPYVTLEELSEESFLLEIGGQTVQEAFSAAGIEPTIRLEVEDDPSILSMVQDGLGVTILPYMVMNHVDYRVAVKPIVPLITRDIYLISKDRRLMPAASRRFIDYMFAHMEAFDL